MNPQRPPMRPNRPPMSREEYMRRQAYYRRMQQRKQMQRRIAILAVLSLFLIMTIILISVALHRAAAPTGLPTETSADTQQTAAPETTGSEPTTSVPAVSTTQQTTICIDPGHGFDDPGASSTFLGSTQEKDITLAISLKLRDELTARGYKVLMTHDTNQIPADAPAGEPYLFGVRKRAPYVNELSPDFLISIHADAFDDPSVQGARVYYHSATGKDNTVINRIAQRIVDALTLALQGAKKAPLLVEKPDDSAYYILRNVDMPAVLVEVGFVSNENDAANMLDDAWQTKVVLALADGIDQTFGTK